jgi:ceramide glucosyltransferase
VGDPIVLGWAVLAGIFTVSIILTMLRHGKRVPPSINSSPPCSLIVPIKGQSQFSKENILALGELDAFPGEILLTIASQADSAVAILLPIVNAHRWKMQLLIGEAKEFANPKLRNFAPAYLASQHDIIMCLDDSIRLDRGVYCKLLAALTADVALVTIAPIGTDAENFAGEIEAATCNGYVFRIQMLLDLIGRAGAFGGMAAFRKSDLEAVGGLRRLTEGPCEDNALSNALSGPRGRLKLLPDRVDRRIGRRGWRDTYYRHLRWKICTKCHDFPALLIEPIFGGLVLNLLGTVALSRLLGISGWYALGISMAGCYGMEALLHRIVGWRISPMTPFAWLARDIGHPILTIIALSATRVVWRGDAMSMRRQTRG